MSDQPASERGAPEAAQLGTGARGEAAHTQMGRRPAAADAAGTQLGQRRPGNEATGTQLGQRRPGNEATGTQLGSVRSASADRPGGGVVRFGPGVPAAPPWRTASAPVPVRRRRAGRLAPVLTALAVAGLLAYLLLWRADPLAVVAAEVVPASPPGAACDVTVDVVGTIHTNGLGGTVEYRWLRSDGEATARMIESVDAGQTVVQVHLFWTLAGRGTYPATATLQILHPQPVTATGGFTYSCR